MSGVGKGVTTSSIGMILQSKGISVNPLKIDPYLNVDAGTMNPTEHGEVFVLDSGLECDQDMGNYERFLNKELPRENYMTNGMILKYVIEKERSLGYGGKCVEPVFHITEDILRRIEESRKKSKSDVTIIEIGGTIGEYQNSIFIEAARLLKIKSPKDVLFVMVTYLPVPGIIGEMKTKPTQNAIRLLNSYGVSPDIVIARSTHHVDQKRKEKIAESSGVPASHIISAPDIDTIYEVPINFERDGLGKIICDILDIKPPKNFKSSYFKDWSKIVNKIKSPKSKTKIAIVGKYFQTGDFVLSDVYISVIESLKHAAGHLSTGLSIDWVDAVDFEDKKNLKNLKGYDGILVPGGFGSRAIEGKIEAIRYARENKVPYFGLCYGMQLAVVEFARNVAGMKKAHSTEVDRNTPFPVIDIMPEQIKKLDEGKYGGTMRLGGYEAILKKGSLTHKLYAREIIKERHRHRFEVNPKYVENLENSGLIFSGKSPDGHLMEIVELPKNIHPFFIGTQFHPEFTGTLLNPHPLFMGFVKAAMRQKA